MARPNPETVTVEIQMAVHRERRWTSAGATPDRELVRSTQLVIGAEVGPAGWNRMSGIQPTGELSPQS
jgi:hypothetical protein